MTAAMLHSKETRAGRTGKVSRYGYETLQLKRIDNDDEEVLILEGDDLVRRARKS